MSALKKSNKLISEKMSSPAGNSLASGGISLFLIYSIVLQMFLPMVLSNSLQAQTSPPKKISPIVECVIPHRDETYDAWMGFNNPNAFNVNLSLGNSNKFTSAPVDRGQPVSFAPGRHGNVFSLENVSGNQVWTLNGKTATASISHPTRCQLISTTITSPAANLTVNDSRITVSGTATSNGPHPLGIAQVFVNNQPAAYDSATKDYSLSNLALSVGENTISVRAVDTAGNEDTSQIKVNRQLNNQPSSSSQAISTTTVLGRFFAGTTTGGYEVPSGQEPLFTQQFPSVNFNPAPNTVINQPPDVNTSTRPMVNITTDTNGNYTGRITVEGNGYQVGKVGSLMPVAATFSANFNVAAAGEITFNFYSDDGFYFGVGGGATRVGGVNTNVPPSGRTAYLDLPIMGGYNVKTAPVANSITVNFPAPGVYPYEIDWADCCMTQEALTMTTSLTGRSVPPAGSIVLTPAITTPQNTGQQQVFTATVTDAAGTAAPNQVITFKVSGVNPQQSNATTNANGQAIFSYAGAISGSDKIQATGEITSLPMFSNEVRQDWQAPANQPPIANFSVPTIGGPVGLSFISASSSTSYSTPTQLLDENRSTRWTTADGQNSNQYATFEVVGGEQLIDKIKLQQSNISPETMVKDFVVQISQTTSDDNEFFSVLSGTLLINDQLQEFSLPNGARRAKFVKLIAVNTQGVASSIWLGTFQVIGAGTADNIVSLPGRINVATAGSPSLLQNGASITRYSSFETYYGNYTNPPSGILTGVGWTTKTRTNEFVVVKLGGEQSHSLSGVRVTGSYPIASSTYVKNFELWVSDTVDEDNAFTKVLDATKTKLESEDFIFPGGTISAKYIKFVPKTSDHPQNISTGGIEVLGDNLPGVVDFSSIGANAHATSAIDGNSGTSFYWAYANNYNQWIKLRLEGERVTQIYGVKIGAENTTTYGNFGPRDFQIKVSTTTTDDAAFTTIYSGTLAATRAMQEFRFDQPVNAKYVQFYWVNSYSPNSWLSVHSLEALSLPSDGAALTNVSSQYDLNSTPIQILDLDQDQIGWQSADGQNVNQSFSLRLYNGKQFNINHVSLRPGWSYYWYTALTGMSPKNFDVQISTTDDTDSSYTTVFSGTLLASDQLQHFYFPSAPARYVRLLLRDNYGYSNMALKSFFVYAENTGGMKAKFLDWSTDPDNDLISYHWNFGDGQTSEERNPTHNYLQEGEYNVSLTVTDSGGATNTIQKTYRALPTLKADFSFTPLDPVEGETYPATVHFADLSSPRLNSSGVISRLLTNGSDFTFPMQGQGYFSTIYRDNGNYPTIIEFGSDYVLNYRTAKIITVQNQPPTVDISDGKTVFWGENWTNDLISLSDPGPVDRATLQGTWDFGDGQIATCSNCTIATAQGNHAYIQPGTYVATLSIADKDGGVSSDSTTYSVIKRPTTFALQSPIRSENSAILRGELLDTYANIPLAEKPLQLNVNGVVYNLATNMNGTFEITVPLTVSSQIANITAFFAEDDFYQSSSSIYSVAPNRENPPTGTPTNGGNDFWLTFPANYGGSLALLVTSEVDTIGTVVSACGVNESFQVTARETTRVPIAPGGCQLQTSDQIQNLGIHVSAQNPVVVYGMNEYGFTTDAFLALPVDALGKNYYILAYGNASSFEPSSQFGVVATEDDTMITIVPSVATDTRLQDVPYQITLNQGQTYLLKNTEVGNEKDLTGTSITADKSIAVFGGHRAATLPAPTTCCADHLVEQLPPVNTWGKRFVLIASATRTKGDIFRFIASVDNTAIYLSGVRATTLNKGQFYEKLIKDPTEVISSEPIMVGQYSTSSGFDTATFGGDPFMAIVPPYSQFLSHYTIATPNRFENFINLAVPTSITGQVTLDGSLVSQDSFTDIGSSGFSSAVIPISIGTHNLDAPAPFGVLSYGYSKDEGYGYPGGMSLIPTIKSVNLSLSPETAAFGINSQACAMATLKDQDNNPLGGKTVNLNVVGVNQANGSGSTNVSGQYEFCYAGTKTGSDTITAIFEDTADTGTFIWSSPNQSPMVNAGEDQTITSPNSVNLSGAVTDDGLPNNSLTSVWSKVSGSGNVALADASSAVTTASFDAAGVYVLRLTASDGQFLASDEVTITVNPASPNQPPTANAGFDQSVTLNANLVKNPSAELDLVNGELADWTQISGNNWTRAQSETDNVPAARFGEYVFSSVDAAQGELVQDIDVRAFAPSIDAGTQSFEWKAYLRSALEENADAGRIIFEYRDAANQNTLAALDSGEIVSTDGWHLTEDARVPPAGTGFIRIRLLTTRNTGATTDVFFDGLSLKPAGVIAAIKLSGAAADDGLPIGSSLTNIWTKVSGGGNVFFGDINALDSPATFGAAGNYVLRLTTSDGQFAANDEMSVAVNPANQMPEINAGADQTITLPQTATLNGSGADDGGSLRYRWTKVSGAGSVSFSSPVSLNPAATFSLAGTYVLRLTGEDGELEASDEVTVTVNPSPTNQPPTVSAGNNQNITLPTNSVILSGTVADDGLPNDNLFIQWTKRSGAGNVAFANATNPQTAATFDAAGSYVLRLTASDGQYTISREVAVIVSPEGGGQNQAPNVDAGADQTITLAQTAILEAAVSDDGLPAGGSFSAAWTKVSGNGGVTFSNPDQTATYATFSQTGVYVLRLTVSDSELTASDDVSITVIDNQSAPTAEILTPDDGISITEPTAVAGTVSGGDWQLGYSLTDTDDPVERVWTTFASGTGAASGNLGELDTTLMLNGLYDVRLKATDQYGQSSTDVISVAVENNLKVGHFTVSFEDMNVPVAGVPMQIVRTYDSRDRRRGDFGIGWTLGIKNVRIEKNTILGLKWYQTKTDTFIPTYCVEATRPHIVTVTMPDGEVEKFEARLDAQCQQAAPITEAHLSFAPQMGTRGTLAVSGDDTVYVAGSVPGPVDLVAYDGTGIFDRTEFKYTAKDGTEFVIRQGAGGLQTVRDTNNNTLTITSAGITHSSGASIAFTRDAQGRITQITDPNGQTNLYTYDADGDLISYRDRENNTTAFTYEPTIPHHLQSIIDPLGRTPIRNEYDAAGRLTKHTDASGNEITYTHELAARRETVTDRLSNATVFEYDARGNVLLKRDALGNETSYTYDADDNLLSETDASGKTTAYTYDNFDNRTSVTDALGNRTEMTYNARGQVLTLRDALDHLTTNTYDSAGNLLTSVDALGNTTTNFYSIQSGRLTRTTDALGNVTQFEYGGNYLTKQTDALGNETTFAYDANGNRTSQTVKRTKANGQLETITTAFEYDNLNRLTKTTLADGTSTRTEYNALGQQAATIDQAGRRTEFEYDTLGRLIKTTYADDKFEESTFDAEGRRLTSKDRSGKITSYEYDALGRLKKTTYADGTFTQTSYNSIGQVTSSTDARNNSTIYTYDDAGRRLTVQNALSQITSFAYDANGNQAAMTDALNHTTSFVYDALNRRTKTVFADNSFTETTFDALGRRVSEKDQAGKITSFTYDSLGRLTKLKDALDQETIYGYNELGQQTKQIDALGRETKFEYDKLGRRTKRILPLGQTETYSYANDGNLLAKTDFNGKTTTFGYDNMRRLLSKTPDSSLNEPSVSFTYNDLGQRDSMTDASGTTNYAYDVRNRLASKQTSFGTLSYNYNANGNIKTLRSSNSGGVSVDYSYDELSRLSTVKDNRLAGNQTTTYAYDAVGNLQSYTYPNQVTTSYNYNNLNRLANLSVSNASGNLASYAYTLGASGNRTQFIEGNGRTINYAYDDLYRLTSETIANSANNGSISYNYDAVGNRLQRNSNVSGVQTQSSTFDNNDRINSDTFDDNGSTKISNGKTYNYDFENKLTSTSGGITIVYDGDGNRVSKTVGAVTTNYLVDTNNLTGYAQVVEELQNGQVVKAYTYGHDLISQRQSSGVSFYNYDGHGSVRSLTNNLGQITDTYDYDAFGNLIGQTGTTSNSYLYAGEQFDADLGFYYNRARYLNVDSGRFISHDSFEGGKTDPITLHKYLYANADGVNNIDPSGNFSIAEVAVALAVSAVILTMSSCRISNVIPTEAVTASFFWENKWLDLQGAETLDAGEIQIIKDNAYNTFQKAYVGYNVKWIEGGGGNREIKISDAFVSAAGQTPKAFSRTSFVFYRTLKTTLSGIIYDKKLNLSRREELEALGRGIGATAAHELGHQSGLEYSSHPTAQGFYDTETLNDTSYDHFFGDLRWSERAKQVMNDKLLKVD